MSIARVASRAQVGLLSPPVQIEVHLGSGLPSFHIVGLPATEVKESRERVRAAFENAGFEWPGGRITVNLAPAELPKDGARFDLAIAIGILRATGRVRRPRRASRRAVLPLAEGLEFYGELGLDGTLRAVTGILPAIRAASAAGRDIVVPLGNAAELIGWPFARAYLAPDLAAVAAALEGTRELECTRALAAEGADALEAAPGTGARPALSDVCGQHIAKRALVVAAAGGHSVLLCGPPGCGKTMLAQRFASLLPPLTIEERLEVATVASVVGQSVAGSAPSMAQGRERGAVSARGPAAIARPFRAPHHTASAAAIVGGGPQARPGEVTLAHHGVLFLDELPEFNRSVLEALREPLECGLVTIARARLKAEYPARFQLIAAMNPCPCGHHGDEQRACRCTPRQREDYRARLSGPLLDRIDLRVSLSAVSAADVALQRERAQLSAGTGEENGAGAMQRLQSNVAAARRRQLERNGGRLNAELDAAALDQLLPMSTAAQRLLERTHRQLALSMRALTRVRRIAVTLADLVESARIEAVHVAEAVQLRRGGPQ